MSSEPSIVVKLAWPMALGIVAGVMSRMAAGTGMGFYFAGLTLAGILIPLLIAFEKRVRDALLVAAAIFKGVALVWLVFVFASDVTFGQWLGAYLVLLATSFAITGITLALRRLLGPDVSAAITITLLLAWLSCPIWSASIASTLAFAHPLLTLNHIFINQRIWTQQRLMYDLTALGQDVPYALPRTIAICVVTHGAIALATSWLAATRARPAASVPPPSAMSPAP